MEDVDSIIVKNLEILQCEAGAELVGSSHVIVTDSYLALNEIGVHMLNCEQCEVSESSITLNDLDGVLVESSGNIVIEDNTFYNNDGPAFHFVNSNDGEAGNNRVLDHIDGIYIESGSRNSVHDSWIPNVGNVAIMIGSGASDTSLSWNNILDLQHDMVDDGVNSNISYNYWANYSGADADSDGIGDTPYSLAGSAGNSDPFPLVYYARVPIIDPVPANRTIEYGTPFSYNLNATSDSPLKGWEIDDTTHFTIDSNGVITNIVTLQAGDYSLEVTVENIYNYTASATFTLTVTGGTTGSNTWLLLGIGVVGTILVVGVVVVFIRRR
jgi:parallel beta-helix repeat protein